MNPEEFIYGIESLATTVIIIVVVLAIWFG